MCYSDDAALPRAGPAQATAYYGSLAEAGRGVSRVLVSSFVCIYEACVTKSQAVHVPDWPLRSVRSWL